jgi:coproporphyrinogen III oxidase-like Fe-S oxidoreductase
LPRRMVATRLHRKQCCTHCGYCDQ